MTLLLLRPDIRSLLESKFSQQQHPDMTSVFPLDGVLASLLTSCDLELTLTGFSLLEVMTSKGPEKGVENEGAKVTFDLLLFLLASESRKPLAQWTGRQAGKIEASVRPFCFPCKSKFCVLCFRSPIVHEAFWRIAVWSPESQAMLIPRHGLDELAPERCAAQRPYCETDILTRQCSQQKLNFSCIIGSLRWPPPFS